MNKNTENILKYLKEVVSLKYKTYYRYTDDDTVIYFNDIPENNFCTSVAKSEKCDADEWLNIKKMKKPEVPPIPANSNHWVIEHTLEDTDDLPALYAQIVFEEENLDGRLTFVPTEKYLEEKLSREEIEELEGLTDSDNDKPLKVLNLSEEPGVQQAWDEYVENKWIPWCEKYIIWHKNDKIYKQIYMIHQVHTKASEDYELLLSLGQLTWLLPNKNIQVHRHVITAKARLEFIPASGRFALTSDYNGAELKIEYDMLDHHAPADIVNIEALLSVAKDNPWENEVIEKTLKAFVNSISDGSGIYDSTLSPNTKCTNKPTIHFAPAIVFRKRRQLSIQRAIKELEVSGQVGIPYN